MLSLDRLFQSDFEDGSLDLLVMSSPPLEFIVLAKVAAHWLVAGLPLIVAAPFLAVALRLPADGFLTLIAVMAIGTPTLSLIGAIGAALTLGARRGGVLVSLLVLPPFIPVLVFGVAAIDAAISGLAVRPHLLILGGYADCGTATGALGGSNRPPPGTYITRQTSSASRSTRRDQAAKTFTNTVPIRLKVRHATFCQPQSIFEGRKCGPAVVRRRYTMLPCYRIVFCNFRVAGGLPTGRNSPHHVHSCSLRLDGHVHIRQHGDCQCGRTHLEASPRPYRRQIKRADWRSIHNHLSHHGHVVGETNMGHLVGLGCATYFGLNSAVSLRWLYRVGERIR